MQFLTKTIIFAITFLLFAFSVEAQHRKSTRNLKVKSSKITKKSNSGKLRIVKPNIISAGVMNGKAIDLVKPEYPRTAQAIKASGRVFVGVLIDENGNVTEAKVLRGNIFLQHATLKAAKLSKFAPFILNNRTVKATGVLVYNFTSTSPLNWLEIGFAFENRDYLASRKFEEVLPSGFDEERELLRENGFSAIAPIVISSIESKISNDEKKFWLFKVGRLLGKLTERGWDKESRAEKMQNLQPYLVSAPESVSKTLVAKIEELSQIEDQELFNEKFLDLYDRLYSLGN